jgi:hypothetical protein
MNTFDRGVEEVDAAFDRRMAKIEMLPSEAVAAQFLVEAKMRPELRSKVLNFFRGLQRLPERHARIGHTYFMGLRTEDDLQRRWRFQLVHVLRKAYRLNPEGFNRVEASWQAMFAAKEEGADDQAATDDDAARDGPRTGTDGESESTAIGGTVATSAEVRPPSGAGVDHAEDSEDQESLPDSDRAAEDAERQP